MRKPIHIHKSKFIYLQAAIHKLNQIHIRKIPFANAQTNLHSQMQNN